MKSSVRMSVLLSCFLVICFPEAVRGKEKAKAIQEITDLHRSNESVSNPHTRIIGGERAYKGEWPWQAALVHTANLRIFCGGTLIKRQWVLTAAHCFDNVARANTLVWLGAHKAVGGLKTADGQEFTVIRLIIHNQYNRVTNSHDIALIKLDRRANIITDYKQDMVKAVRLATANDGPLLMKSTLCVVTGFGVKDDEETRPDYLQKARVNVVPLNECRSQYGVGRNVIDDTMICAGRYKGNFDACQGDSGGPLVCRHDDLKYYLHGIVSMGLGEGCGKPKRFGVYTNVIPFLRWITSNAV